MTKQEFLLIVQTALLIDAQHKPWKEAFLYGTGKLTPQGKALYYAMLMMSASNYYDHYQKIEEGFKIENFLNWALRESAIPSVCAILGPPISPYSQDRYTK
jgi:hypothetical protein